MHVQSIRNDHKVSYCPSCERANIPLMDGKSMAIRFVDGGKLRWVELWGPCWHRHASQYIDRLDTVLYVSSSNKRINTFYLPDLNMHGSIFVGSGVDLVYISDFQLCVQHFS